MLQFGFAQWLAFLKHQDEFIAMSRSSHSSDLTYSIDAYEPVEAKRATAESKLAILEKALTVTRTAAVAGHDRNKLVLERLRVGEMIWDRTELKKEWRRAIDRAGAVDGDEILAAHVDWLARTGSTFTLLTTFAPAAEKALQTMTSVEIKLETFDKVVRIYRRAGA